MFAFGGQMTEQVKAQSSADLLSVDYPLREFILLAGKDGVGKSSALVSLAWWIEQNKPNAIFNVIDTENKLKSALRSFGSDAPGNIQYYKTGNMNEVNSVVAMIMANHKPGDWLAVESMGPIWDMAQDLAYQSIAGMTKAEFLERKGKGKGPIPQPDDFWKIAKGAYDGAFLDPIRQSEDLNVILTSVAKPVKADGGFIKENRDRKAFRIEVGMDANLSGSPTMPSIVETLALLELNQGNVSCRILRDNLSVLESSRIEFPIPTKRDFAVEFWSQCRNSELKL
jgi:energy-coupling factor transporter ATP-binding protein EcfA2